MSELELAALVALFAYAKAGYCWRWSDCQAWVAPAGDYDHMQVRDSLQPVIDLLVKAETLESRGGGWYCLRFGLHQKVSQLQRHSIREGAK